MSTESPNEDFEVPAERELTFHVLAVDVSIPGQLTIQLSNGMTVVLQPVTMDDESLDRTDSPETQDEERMMVAVLPLIGVDLGYALIARNRLRKLAGAQPYE